MKFKRLDKIEIEVDRLSLVTREYRRESNQREQWNRQLNIEITGIPESETDAPSVAFKVAMATGVEIKSQDIEFASRVAQFKPDSGRPRAIIAKIKNRQIKDGIISAIRKKRGLKTSEIGIKGTNNQIYINEHLTPSNKLLYRQVRDKCKEAGFQYCWVRNCRIHIRRNDATPYTVISSEEDLGKITLSHR